MTSGNMRDDAAQWRRPPAGATPPEHPPEPSANPVPNPAPAYSGPPPTTPPPPGWRPPVVVRPAPPRQLPAQDPTRLDLEEQSARTLTYGVAMVAGAIMLVLTLILCGRWLF